MRQWKLALVCAAALFTLSLATACNRGSKKQAGQVTVGVVLKTLSSPYWQTVQAGLVNQAKDDGIRVDVIGPPTEDAIEQQINMVQDIMTQDVDVLVFSPSQPNASIKVMDEAKAKGIPVILVDTKMPDGYEDYATFIGTENYAAGVSAAEKIMTIIPKTGKIVIIDGAPGNPSTNQRCDGAEKVFKDNGYNVVTRQPAFSDKNRAYDVMTNILQSDPDIAAVFSANDDMGLGAYRALDQRAKTQNRENSTWVLGVDATNDALDVVIAGGKYITLAQNSYGMGTMAIENAQKLAKGETIDKRIDSGTQMIDTAEAAQTHQAFLKSILPQ
jgi:ribose transport system substrate-binding protein